MSECAGICVKMMAMLNPEALDPMACKVAWHIDRGEFEEATRLLESLYEHGRVDGAREIVHSVPQLMASFE